LNRKDVIGKVRTGSELARLSIRVPSPASPGSGHATGRNWVIWLTSAAAGF